MDTGPGYKFLAGFVFDGERRVGLAVCSVRHPAQANEWDTLGILYQPGEGSAMTSGQVPAECEERRRRPRRERPAGSPEEDCTLQSSTGGRCAAAS